MKKEERYSYLSDPRAIAEIHKHKWIESQKAGREIGFATAAVDWIKTYGSQWKASFVHEEKDLTHFIERRKFRRPKIHCLINLMKDRFTCVAESINISLYGLLCRTSNYLTIGSDVIVNILNPQNQQLLLTAKGTVTRAHVNNYKNYELYLQFDENTQKALQNWPYFRILE